MPVRALLSRGRDHTSKRDRGNVFFAQYRKLPLHHLCGSSINTRSCGNVYAAPTNTQQRARHPTSCRILLRWTRSLTCTRGRRCPAQFSAVFELAWLKLSQREQPAIILRATQADVVAQLQLGFGVLDVAAGLMILKPSLRLRGYLLGLPLAASGVYAQLANGGSARDTGIFAALVVLGMVLHA